MCVLTNHIAVLLLLVGQLARRVVYRHVRQQIDRLRRTKHSVGGGVCGRAFDAFRLNRGRSPSSKLSDRWGQDIRQPVRSLIIYVVHLSRFVLRGGYRRCLLWVWPCQSSTTRRITGLMQVGPLVLGIGLQQTWNQSGILVEVRVLRVYVCEFDLN